MTDQITIESGISFETLVPFVVVQWGDKAGQLSLAEARQHALRILEVTEAAEQDAYIVWFMREVIKAPMEKVALLLNEFRAKRSDFEKAKHASRGQ